MPLSLPTRQTRHYSYTYAPPHPNARDPYVSPDPSPTSPSFPHATPLVSHTSLPAPRGYPPGHFFPPPPLFSTSTLDRARLEPGYGGPGFPGYASYSYPQAEEGVPRYLPGVEAVRRPMGELDPYYVPALPSLVKEDKRGKKPKKAVDAKQPTFLTKLYGILEQQEYHHIIRWDPAGEVIIIERPDELCEKVLPLVYRQSRFASFSRQLNIYGFMRKVSLRHVEERIVHPDASTWSHGFLCRESPPDDILAFKRRVQPRRSQSKRRASAPDQLLSPTESEFSDPSDAYYRNLLADSDEQECMPRPSTSSSLLPFQAPPGAPYDQLDSTPEPTAHAISPESPAEEPVSAPVTSAHPFQSSEYDQSYAYTALPIPAEVPPLTPGGAQPHSAPVFSQGYMDLQVMQGHLRTRSVQGEPPSATLWSPMPYGQTQTQPWTPSLPSQAEGLQLTSSDQDGWVNSYTNEPIPPPPSSLGMMSERMSAQAAFGGPASVPTSFAPGQGLHNRPRALGEAFQYHVPAELIYGHHTGFDALGHQPPATVSPGVYQAGFTSPVHILQRSISSPRPAPSYPSAIAGTRQDRRQSIPSTPYSPHRRPRALTLAGQASMSPSRGAGFALRNLALGGMSDGYKSSTMGTPELVVPGLPISIVGMGDDDGLPSAGMEIGEHPFHALLRKEDMADNEEA